MTKQITITLDKDAIETLIRSAYGVPTDPVHTITWDLQNQRLIIAAATQNVDITEDHPHVTGA